MASEYSADSVLEFLALTSERGLMPAATAQALAVASRNVFAVLDPEETGDLREVDLDKIIKRFNNKRARDFNPASLKEYGRRVQKAVRLFLEWRQNPAEFTVATRGGSGQRVPVRTRQRVVAADAAPSEDGTGELPLALPPASAPAPTFASASTSAPRARGGFQTAFPVRAGIVVTLSNVPDDLSAGEAERLSQFVRMLAAS